jgi:hypothetical protein
VKKFLILTLTLLLAFCLINCTVEYDGSQSTPQESTSISTESELQSESSQPVKGYTVTFDTDGGNAIEDIFVNEGGKIQRPKDPEKSSRDGEYEFVCWLYNGEEWDFDNDVVTENLTLVAKWELVVEYPPAVLPED